MNVLELCEFYSNYSGNFIPSLVSLENKIQEKGHKIFYIFSNKNLSDKFLLWEKPFSAEHKVTLFDFESKKFVNDVVKFIKENDIDVVHGHFLSSKLFSDIKKKTNKNVRFYQHIHNSFYKKKNLYAFLKRIRNLFFLDHSIVKICCSNSIVNSAKYTFPLSKVLSVKNAIDFSRLERRNFNRLEKNNILLFGHNYYVKGVDIAIEATLRLAEKYDVCLDIVMGDRFDENLKRIIDKYGCVPKCVNILKPTNNVNELYKTHQIFLNASYEEGMSYANIEAYYSGCLFVSSDIPQNKEPDLPNVLYFTSRNVDELTKKLSQAFDIKNEYKNDCNYVETFFSNDRWANEICSILELN